MATTECPICSRHVRAENLMLHVDACLAKQDQPKTQFRSPSPSAKTKSPTTSRTPNRSPPPQNSPSSSALKKRKRSTTDDVSAVPLAERMRPKDLDDLVGQEELLGPGSLLSALIEADRVPNMILWG
ncbi:ATPase WRNIP1 [Phytophthora nicotianae]|nr:ATPase WRNIP1 [Phytophthora nicotianae]KUF84022.1 ATPase WRNIP1 [Phytophthora nicotianae]